MFSRKSHEPDSHVLDESIETLIASLADLDKGEEKYAAKVADLKTLMELRSHDYEAWDKRTVSPEVLVAAGAHILGIVMILGFEKRNVITSKAMSFIPKIRM